MVSEYQELTLHSGGIEEELTWQSNAALSRRRPAAVGLCE